MDVTQLQEFQQTVTTRLDRINEVLDYLIMQFGNGAGNEQSE
jgi:hypothetical protein